MKTSDGNGARLTHLKPVDHERFFEAMDLPPIPSGALRDAFRRGRVAPSPVDTDFPTND
jgi:hypothetical protein